MRLEYYWEIQEERDHCEDCDVSRQMLLKWILQGECVVVWAELIWFKIGVGHNIIF
jgi:hypothetical protein